jgi:hypothetical protein
MASKSLSVREGCRGRDNHHGRKKHVHAPFPIRSIKLPLRQAPLILGGT